jgi:hypothetical protein
VTPQAGACGAVQSVEVDVVPRAVSQGGAVLSALGTLDDALVFDVLFVEAMLKQE